MNRSCQKMLKGEYPFLAQTLDFSRLIWKVLCQHSWLPGQFGGNTYSKKTITDFRAGRVLKNSRDQLTRYTGGDIGVSGSGSAYSHRVTTETRIQVSRLLVQCSFNYTSRLFFHEYLVITLYKNKNLTKFIIYHLTPVSYRMKILCFLNMVIIVNCQERGYRKKKNDPRAPLAQDITLLNTLRH